MDALSDKSGGERSAAALLRRRLAAVAAGEENGLPVSRDQPAPLSFAQERVWFMEQLAPESGLANRSFALRLRGSLDTIALRRSLQEIVRRHEVLRSIVRLQEGRPWQIVRPPVEIGLPLVDLQATPAAERETALSEQLQRQAVLPFDLSRDLLLRPHLWRLGEADHVLLLATHHLAADAWSDQILWDELSTHYAAYSAGESAPLDDLPWQYGDYARWQRSAARQGANEGEIAYWKTQLAGIESLSLPLDYERPLVQAHKGAEVTQQLTPDLYAALKRLSQDNGVTPFMTFLAAFQLLLARLSGQNDVAVGAPIANRNQASTEKMIGCFLNNLVLRTDLSGDPSFVDLLARVRAVTTEAMANQSLSFEQLLNVLQPERLLNQTPLFNVFINSLTSVRTPRSIPRLAVENLPLPHSQAQFDLTLYLREFAAAQADQPPALAIGLNFDVALSAPTRAQEILAQYVQLLLQIAADAKRPIGDYTLLTPRARQLLPDPSARLDATWRGSIVEHFEAQARAAPERPAVIHGQVVWTYQQLADSVTHLAAELLARGLKRGDIVAIYAGRGAELVAAVLAVLKAGGAFLILNAGYPRRRLLQYLELARPRGLISWQTEVQILFQEWPLPDAPFYVDQIPFTPAAEKEPVKFPSLGPDDVACVAFTSGTTAVPKGVVGRHGSLTHFLPWQSDTLQLTGLDRFSMISAVNYDGWQRELFTALFVGGTLVIADQETLLAPGQLARWIAENGITFTHMTPPMAAVLSQSPPQGGLASLRYLFSLGDRLTGKTVESVRSVAPQVTIINSFGSTETQRAVSIDLITPEAEVGSTVNLPVGRAIPNVQLLVMNSHGETAGVGEVGELWIRSPHLALGYLNDEAATAARFLDDPHGRDSGSRLYRTGDLGRYLPDGRAVYLRRSDGQVKIRGHRVDVAEIEALLSAHPLVNSCAVTYRTNIRADQELAAFVVPQSGTASGRELSTYLKARLPAHMLPASYTFLERMPLTANGKADRRALSKMAADTADKPAAEMGPTNALEAALVAIWQEVLAIEDLDVHADFFEMGGHSLLGMQILARIEEDLGIKVPISLLFTWPTIALLAAELSGGQSARDIF